MLDTWEQQQEEPTQCDWARHSTAFTTALRQDGASAVVQGATGRYAGYRVVGMGAGDDMGRYVSWETRKKIFYAVRDV